MKKLSKIIPLAASLFLFGNNINAEDITNKGLYYLTKEDYPGMPLNYSVIQYEDKKDIKFFMYPMEMFIEKERDWNGLLFLKFLGEWYDDYKAYVRANFNFKITENWEASLDADPLGMTEARLTWKF